MTTTMAILRRETTQRRDDAPPVAGSPGAIAPGPAPDSFPDLPDTAYGLDWAGLTPRSS
jgi:hypothetical protein